MPGACGLASRRAHRRPEPVTSEPARARYLKRMDLDGPSSAPSRRSLRASGASGPTITIEAEPDESVYEVASSAVAPLALAWVDESRIRARGASTPAADPAAEVDLLASPPRLSPWRPGVILPLAVTALLLAVYVTGALLWPLHAVTPTIDGVQLQPVPAPATTPAWPASGSAGVAVDRIGATVSSTPDASEIASITKLVTALLVLDEMPLAPGEQGIDFRFSSRDEAEYWDYLDNGESALDVPVGGVLTQYQLLEGMLIGSANNYAARLDGNLWPSDAVFASAARTWLEAHGLNGITVVEPTGIDSRNTASPDALIQLGHQALANPVIAGIVAMPSVELPGAGLVTNTNGLLADPGIVGIKTGSLDAFSLLSAKDVMIGETRVRLFAAVQGQPDDGARIEASRALYAQLEQELQLRPSVPAGTTVGMVHTAWGTAVPVVTAADASVVLWNGAVGETATSFSLGDARGAGSTVGTLTVRGPLDSVAVDLRLRADVEGPSPWWRITHPIELLGVD